MMKKTVAILLLALGPLCAFSISGQYEFLVRVTGIEGPAKCKMVYGALHDLDPNIEISHHDEFTALKLRSDLRLDASDLELVLVPLGVNVIDLQQRSQSPTSNTSTPHNYGGSVE